MASWKLVWFPGLDQPTSNCRAFPYLLPLLYPTQTQEDSISPTSLSYWVKTYERPSCILWEFCPSPFLFSPSRLWFLRWQNLPRYLVNKTGFSSPLGIHGKNMIPTFSNVCTVELWLFEQLNPSFLFCKKGMTIPTPHSYGEI